MVISTVKFTPYLASTFRFFSLLVTHPAPSRIESHASNLVIYPVPNFKFRVSYFVISGPVITPLEATLTKKRGKRIKIVPITSLNATLTNSLVSNPCISNTYKKRGWDVLVQVPKPNDTHATHA